MVISRNSRKSKDNHQEIIIVYVVGDEEYESVLDDLIQAGLSVVKMSSFCSKEDKFPSIDELVDYFRTSDVDYRDNKFVVVGLGEYLALRGGTITEKELRRLKNTTLGNARAVLLLRGVSPQAIRIINDDSRMVEQQRAYIGTNEAHTACDKNGFVLETVVTPGNVHDSVAFDEVYDKVTEHFPKTEVAVADAAYKTPHICKTVSEACPRSTSVRRP